MKVNEDIINNTVSAANQVTEKFKKFDNVKNGYRVLFLGNSITLHETAPQIGWNNNWGMAASCEANDYVHKVVKGIENVKGKINYCVCNVGAWELDFDNTEVLHSFEAAKLFGADLIIVRLGENVKLEKYKNGNFKSCFAEFLNYFKNDKSKFIITDLFWEYGDLDKDIEAVSKEFNGRFVVLSDLGYDDKNKAIGMFEHVGVALHPNDEGMAKIAERILDAFNNI